MAHCDRCGREVSANNLILTEQKGKWFGICGACQGLMGLCHTCTHRHECSFSSSPSQTEPYIMQEIRQGNTVFRQRVKNPERVRETCQDGCVCFDKEFGCLRQINQTCGNYEEEDLNGYI